MLTTQQGLQDPSAPQIGYTNTPRALGLRVRPRGYVSGGPVPGKSANDASLARDEGGGSNQH